ncbi:ATP-binding protein [Ferrovibrio sp.]|uniref:sensor histidine kinase n=1 Tax=Ferrovibrio sp. TaxID=1917215 RepID=UPI001B44CDA9|nr:ATP-binding protein [Ferrovibrio sp.]MBP7063968.1 hypothetical protein [Ferrovibrio sp.]
MGSNGIGNSAARPEEGGDPLFTSYRQTVPLNAAVTLAIASITAITLMPDLSLPLIGGWWLAQTAYAGTMLAGWWLASQRQARRAAMPPLALPQRTSQQHAARLRFRRRQAFASAILGGSLWGVGAIILDQLDPARQIFLLTVAAGMVSGAATTLASMPAAAAAFVICTVLPYVVVFFLRDEPTYYALSAMALVYVLAMMVSSRIVHGMIARNRRLRGENRDLLERTRAARAALLDVAESAEAFVFTDAEGRVTQWNRKFADLLRLDTAKLRPGTVLAPLLAEGGLAPDAIEAALHGQGLAPLRTAAGRWVRPLQRHTPHGDTALLLLDISEQYAATETLEQQKRRLEELVAEVTRARDAAERASRAKSSFLANMSHELRTPLNAVIGFSDIVRQKLYGPQSPKYDEYISDIHSSATHLLGIIDDILDLARVEVNRIGLHETDIDVAETAAICIRLSASAPAASGKKLRAEIPEDLPLLCGDVRLFRQMLLNLIGNAVKFSGPQGQVCVGACLSDAAPNPGGITVWVQDDGIGIAAADRERIFAPFEQAEAARSRQYGGVGLGLALVRAYVEAHQGSAALQSELGQGTRMLLHFPASRTVALDHAGLPGG